MEPQKTSKPNTELPASLLKEIAVDYIVNEMGLTAICVKHNITEKVFYRIVDYLDLRKKRDEYRRQILDKALSKIAEKQSTALAKTVKILLKHVESIERVQSAIESMPIEEGSKIEKALKKLLPSYMIKDVMDIFSLVSKEQRLDQGLATENVVAKVQVEMGKTIPVFGRTIPDDKQQTPQKEIVQAQIEQKKEEPKKEEKQSAPSVELDESIGMPI